MNSKSLKIAFLDFDDIKNPLLGAGQAKATLEVGKRLVSRGHKVEIISSKYPGYEDRFEEGMLYKHIGLGSSNIRLNNVAYIFSLPSEVKKITADLLVECFTAPVSTLFTPLWTKIPVVVIPTSFAADHFSRVYHLPFQLVERVGLKLYKYHLPYSSYLDNKMKKFNKTVVSKIFPEGVGEEYFRIPRKTPKHILYLGRLEIAQKGLDLLLQAYALSASHIALPLIIAGNGPDEGKVEVLVKQLGLERQVTLIGPTFGEKKKQVMSEALFVAFPSRFEGFSLFALEALAAGLPLVAFDIPGISWTPERATFKAECFDTQEYAKLLVKAASDPNALQVMGTYAREYARQFTWDAVVKEYEDFFYKILSSSRGEITGYRRAVLYQSM